MADKARDPVLDSVWLAEPRPASAAHSPGLSRELIVRTAVEVLDEHGLAALSMRKLAAQLGVAPMSLYWHVPTKDALLELAMDEVYGELGAPDPDVPWTAAARELMVQVRAMFHRHRWFAQLQGRFPGIGPKSVAAVETMLTLLRGAGLSLVEASRASSALVSYVFGYAAAEVRWAEQTSAIAEPDQQWSRVVIERYAPRFPMFVEQLGEPELWSQDAQFDYGLDCVLAGIETRTGQPRR